MITIEINKYTLNTYCLFKTNNKYTKKDHKRCFCVLTVDFEKVRVFQLSKKGPEQS